MTDKKSWAESGVEVPPSTPGNAERLDPSRATAIGTSLEDSFVPRKEGALGGLPTREKRRVPLSLLKETMRSYGGWGAYDVLRMLRERIGPLAHVYGHTQIKGAVLYTLRDLILAAGPGGTSWVSAETLADSQCVHVQTIYRHVSLLRAAGLIESEILTRAYRTGGGRFNFYRVLFVPGEVANDVRERAKGLKLGTKKGRHVAPSRVAEEPSADRFFVEGVEAPSASEGSQQIDAMGLQRIDATPPPLSLLDRTQLEIDSSPSPPVVEAAPAEPTPQSAERGDCSLSGSESDPRSVAKKVLAYWHQILQPACPVVTLPVWENHVKRRLAEGFSEAVLMAVVDGAAVSPWNKEPGRRTVEMLFSKASQVAALSAIGFQNPRQTRFKGGGGGLPPSPGAKTPPKAAPTLVRLPVACPDIELRSLFVLPPNVVLPDASGGRAAAPMEAKTG
jgi:hypothetical protein